MKVSLAEKVTVGSDKFSLKASNWLLLYSPPFSLSSLALSTLQLSSGCNAWSQSNIVLLGRRDIIENNLCDRLGGSYKQ